MKLPKFYWILSWFFALLAHTLILFALFYKSEIKISESFGGFDYPIKDDSFESIAILSDLPIGELKQVSPQSIASEPSQPEPEPEPPKEEPEPEPDIKSQIELEKKQVKKPVKKAQKKPKEQIKKVAVKPNLTKEEPTKKPSEQPSEASINSASKDESSSAPASGDSTRIASTNDGASKEQTKSYQGLVMAKLNRYKKYPRSAITAGQEEILKIRVRLDAKGNVLSAELKGNAKYEILANEARELFFRASPLPKPPRQMLDENGELKFNIPIEFNIKKFKRYERRFK